MYISWILLATGKKGMQQLSNWYENGKALLQNYEVLWSKSNLD